MDHRNYGYLDKEKSDIRWAQHDEFEFDFINENTDKQVVQPENDYIHGRTLDNKQIYFYCNNFIDVNYGVRSITFNNYILSRRLLNNNCVGIRFTGGILSSLFIPNSMHTKLTENGEYKVSYDSDTIKYIIETGNRKFNICIESKVIENSGLKGKSLENNEVVLDLISEQELTITDILPLYDTIIKMCSFLTFRKNVMFEKVELLENEYIDGNRYHTTFAELFCSNDFMQATKKNYLECINFTMLGDSLVPLFKAIYEEKEKKPFFSLDFIPEDDKDYGWISPDKIRNICTCLEIEAELHNIKAENDEEFIKLIKSVRKIVDDHKNSERHLPDKTYNVINGSIAHWDFATADKVKSLFLKYEEILIQVGCYRYSTTEFEGKIDAFIKYRNNTTHGRYMKISSDLGTTAINLMNLIYISRLDRMGMPWNKIKKIIIQGAVYS